MRQLGAIMLACLFAPPASADEVPLGRLLLTPEQRAALDIARRNKIRADATHKPKPTPTERDITVNGVLKRSDGMSTVWLNGRSVQGETDDGMRVFTVTAVDDTNITVDGNHPLAGQTLHFEVRIASVRNPTKEELAHGHVHGEGGHHH